VVSGWARRRCRAFLLLPSLGAVLARQVCNHKSQTTD
jgi:hypothetical protein